MPIHYYHTVLPAVITGSTLPIYGTHDDFPLVQDRSGVLLKIANHHFLLTAVHEIEQWIDIQNNVMHDGCAFYTSSGTIAFHVAEDRAEETIRLEVTNMHLLKDEIIDIAILELSASTVESLSRKSFITIDDARILTAPKKGVYGVYGHPFELADEGSPEDQTPFVRSPSCWITTSPTDLAKKANHNADHTLLFRYPNNRTTRYNKDFDDTKFKGISGGGIWNIKYKRDGTLGASALLVGIFLWQSPEGEYLGGTSLKSVFTKLTEAYPDLADVISTIGILEL